MGDLGSRLFSKTKLNPSSGCLEWQAYKQLGYGYINMNPLMRKASRVAWEFCNGPIPRGKCVCHSCDNPSCINPDHLWIGTHLENMKDKVRKGRQPREKCISNAKLTPKKVREIRKLYSKGDITIRELAKRYCVGNMTVSDLLREETWRHI